MLNAPLFNALSRLATSQGLGEVTVVSDSKEGTYSVTEPPDTSFNKGNKTLFANVPHSGWGECYKQNCPGCGDTRGRLFISHLWNQRLQRTKNTVVLFSRKLYICHNEHCQLDDYFAKLAVDTSEKAALKPTKAKVADPTADVPLPTPLYSVTNELTPVLVQVFLASRGFDPVELERDWQIGFVPKGAYYLEGEKRQELREDRLYIPVINRRRLMYWQARALVDASWQKRKYLNKKAGNGIGKASLLYNMDRAWRFKRVTIVEGVTDVWRIGFDAVSIFGTSISDEQKRLMKVLWGHAGQACLCLDEDAYDKAVEQAAMLEREHIFPGGVAVAKLDAGKDPADYDTEEIRAKLDMAFETLENRATARAMAAYLADREVEPNLLAPANKEGFE